MAFIKVFHEHGMDVPADVSIIGFDNLAVSPLFIPGLTTISQDINEKAKIAVDTIFRRIKNPQAFIGSVIMDVALIERESVKSLVG
jgi:DNA-binding LacI/PurR family transcriptional regulator